MSFAAISSGVWSYCGGNPWSWLLTYPSVDALAQQVGVPAVTGALLDSVHHQLPNRDPALPQTLAQIRMLGQGGVGRGLLALQSGVRGVDLALLGDGSVEVRVPLD